MLEVTVYKVRHSSQQEARKLLPYIKNSDAWAPEFPFNLKSDNLLIERLWGEELQEGLSRTEFNRRLEQRMQGSNKNPYKLQVMEYLFRSKLAFYLAERFDEDNHRTKAREVSDQGSHLYHQGQLEVSQGNIDAGLATMVRAERLLEEATKVRDKNIAENLETAYDTLRETYSFLGDSIKLGISIGGIHRPEDYSNIPLEVVDLIGDGGFQVMLGSLVREEVPEKEAIVKLREFLEQNSFKMN